MVHAVGGDPRSALALARMKAPCRTAWMWRASDSGVQSGDMARSRIAASISASSPGMGADAAVAGLANGRSRLIGLLQHGADEAGEIGHAALQQDLAEGDMAEHAVERIGKIVTGRSGEQGARHLGPMLGGGAPQFVLALEMMEEGVLGDAGGGAGLVDRGG